MIVCHCNVITCSQFKRACAEMVACDALCVVTPGAAFRACGAKPQCGGCMLNVSSIIMEAHLETPQNGASVHA